MLTDSAVIVLTSSNNLVKTTDEVLKIGSISLPTPFVTDDIEVDVTNNVLGPNTILIIELKVLEATERVL